MSVKVYGFTHSPWVQAVLLALCDKELEYELYVRPPYEVFKKWGVYMPVVSLDDGPWEIESTEILTKLGYKPILDDELKAANNAWQGVLHRTDNPFRFFLHFARGGQISRSLVNNTISNFLLSFVAFYMFMLITIGKWRLKQKEPENFGDQFMYWENVLDSSEGPFMDGMKPGSKDLVMFGIIQCHASIPVPALKSLLNDQRLINLRKWVNTMQNYFKEYPHLYTAKFFKSDNPEANSANLFQIVSFFLGLIVMVLAFPITIPLVLILMSRVEKNRIKRF
tara:strand:+ start:2769 stop:3608 length:840 start_codon:yes stop_codon:yes gene_type:complete